MSKGKTTLCLVKEIGLDSVTEVGDAIEVPRLTTISAWRRDRYKLFDIVLKGTLIQKTCAEIEKEKGTLSLDELGQRYLTLINTINNFNAGV